MILSQERRVRPGEMKRGGEEEAIVVTPPSAWARFQPEAVKARHGQKKRDYPKRQRQQASQQPRI